MKRDGELWWRSKLRQVKYLNNIVEQDPGLRLQAYHSGWSTLL